MAGSISIRKSIRWLPGEAEEPTSTIVLTSPQRTFVDLRILKDAEGQSQGHALPPERLDWAIAGTSSSSTRCIDGQQVEHSRWEHWIDSRTSAPENASDEGDMYPQLDGTTLEKGRMVNPETGVDTAYEEVWDDEDVSPGGGPAHVCVVLRYENGADRGLVVRLGRHCQGFMKIAGQISLERWCWEEKEQRSVCTVRMGSDRLPCQEALDGGAFTVGEHVKVAGKSWAVAEVA
ncbi:hypothetical protein QQS21_006271 [Conoideocrella luteorostrata]|uniref:Protein HRI1 n=1 Tax=Conoideocrella luteorostrata TaxID=1105319 RepID=A0AAJ0CN17_9HYPO|nr:hypothetical protein QQS21_006271 [Conoideocrella luteorostrata]